ncbi:MAG: ArnT family glycosyltransferase [Myxococcota bacterium]
MRRGVWLALAVLLPRLVAFVFNENLGGDAIARTWLAHRWLEAPHLITSFDGGAKQFGPLHIYLLALAEWLWPSLLHAGRLLSLVVGSLTAWPLFDFTRRRFGDEAATWSVALFAGWGVHIQCSATASSEALNLLLVMGAVALLERGRWAGAAVLLNLACATRYDSWLLVPVFALADGWAHRSYLRVLKTGAASSVFALAWLWGNHLARGDAFFPLRFIDEFHRAWWPTEAATWGEGAYRLMCLVFWPGAALLTLGPAAVGGFSALRRAWSSRVESRWLVLLIVLPAVLYGVRGALFASFAPLARFTLKEVLLLIPFAGWWLSQRSRVVASAMVWALVAWTAVLTVFCWRPDTKWPFTLRSISPVTRMDSSVRRPAEWLQQHARAGLLVLDEDPLAYDELIVSYYAGRPFEEQLRRRYERYAEALGDRTVEWLLLIDGGRLTREGAATALDERHVSFHGARYVERMRDGRFRVLERDE